MLQMKANIFVTLIFMFLIIQCQGSWQEYVNEYLVNFTDPYTRKTASNICDSGAIISHDGTVWASTPGFKIDNLTDAFENGNSQIRINGQIYSLVSFDRTDNILYLKRNGGGAAIAKTGLAYVIGTYSTKMKLKNFNGMEEPQNPGMTNRAVETLQKFLLANNM